jgi:hypothetical protein
MKEARQGDSAVNLCTIPVTPHAIGFIKVACADDPQFGEARTRNEFLITQRHHDDRQGQPRLAAHPLQQKLATGEGEAKKVTEIPIRLFFNKASNAIGIKYQAYSTPGNIPVCAGDGKKARRLQLAADNTQTILELPCPGPELCELVEAGKATCRRQVRMAVQIEGQDDFLSVFEVRSSSLNTYRALKAQLQLIERRFGGLRHVPLKLALWQASNEASNFDPFSLMRLVLDAPSELDAMNAARAARKALADGEINDDVDGLHSEVSDDENFVGTDLDFLAVREFYLDPTGRPGRGVTPEVGRQVSAGGSAMSLASVADAAIESAVRRARARSSEALTMSP